MINYRIQDYSVTLRTYDRMDEKIIRSIKYLILTFCGSTSYSATQIYDASPVSSVSYTDPSQVRTTTVTTNTDSIMPYQFIHYLENLSTNEFAGLLHQLTNPYSEVYAVIQYHLNHLPENQTTQVPVLDRIEMLKHYLLLGDINITLDNFQITTTKGEGTYTHNSFLQILYPDSLTLPPLTQQTFDQLMNMQQDIVRRNTFAPILLFSLGSLIDFLEQQLETTEKQLTISPITSLTDIRQKIQHLKEIYQSVQNARDTTEHTKTSLSVEQLFHRLGLPYRIGTTSEDIQITISQPRYLRPSLETFYNHSSELVGSSSYTNKEIGSSTIMFYGFTYTLRLPQANGSDKIYTIISGEDTPQITGHIAGTTIRRNIDLKELFDEMISKPPTDLNSTEAQFTLPPDVYQWLELNTSMQTGNNTQNLSEHSEILKNLEQLLQGITGQDIGDSLQTKKKVSTLNFQMHPVSIQTVIDILLGKYPSITVPIHPEDITSINLSMCNLQNLPSGLERFTNLQELDLSYNNLAPEALAEIHTLPIRTLWLNYNPIGSSDFELPNTLQELHIGNAGLTSLPSPLPDSLLVLDCSNNTIGAIPPLPVGLTHLDISHNHLYFIESHIQNTALAYIDISYNPLSKIPALDGLSSTGSMYASGTNLSYTSSYMLPQKRTLVLEENNGDDNTGKYNDSDYRYLAALQNQYRENMSAPYYTELSGQNNPALMLLNALPAATMSFDSKFGLGNNLPETNSSTAQPAPLLSEVSPPLPGYYRQTVHTFSHTGTLDMAPISGKYQIIDIAVPGDQVVYTAKLSPGQGGHIPLPLGAKIIDSGGIRVKLNNHTGIYTTEPINELGQQVEISFVIDRSQQEKSPRAPRFQQQISVLPKMFSVNTDIMSEEERVAVLISYLQGQYYGFDSGLDNELEPFKSHAITYLNELFNRSMQRYDNSLLTICNQNVAIAVARLNKHGIPARVIGGIHSSGSEVGGLGHAWVEYRNTDQHQWITIDPTSTKTPPKRMAPDMYQQAEALAASVAAQRNQMEEIISNSPQYTNDIITAFMRLPSGVQTKIETSLDTGVLDLSNDSINAKQFTDICNRYILKGYQDILTHIFLTDNPAISTLPYTLPLFRNIQMIMIDGTSIQPTLTHIYLLGQLKNLNQFVGARSEPYTIGSAVIME